MAYSRHIKLSVMQLLVSTRVNGALVKQFIQALPHYLGCLVGLGAVVAADHWFRVNATTAALYMLLVVLGAATRWGLAESAFTSLAGVLAFNFFFLPPVGTFTISDPENWAALFAFLVTAVTASKLSSDAKHRAEEALAGRNELGRLYELSRALLMEEGPDSVRHSVAKAGRILQDHRIAFFDAAAESVYGSVADSSAITEDLRQVARTGTPLTVGGTAITPVRLGAQTVGSLAFSSGRLSSEARESVASLMAIHLERVSALRRAATAEVARRNEEFKSSLLDGLAHDLKTPLTAIRSCVTRLITIPPRTEEVRQELLSIIDQESVRLQSSITDAIELARVESSTLHLEPEEKSVREILEAAIVDVRDEDCERYRADVPEGLRVYADPDLLRRALTQVLENARKYSRPGTPVQVEASGDNAAVIISVLDRGPGLQPDETERIFEKFYRGRLISEEVEGTGMGLAIVKGIVEAHGGTVRAANRLGGGIAITLSLPASPKQDAA